MKTLHLTLKKKWFDMIASGEKKEEYREVKPFWINRLVIKDYRKYSTQLTLKDLKAPYNDQHLFNAVSNDFDFVNFRNGYSKSARSLTIECKGIIIGPAEPEWSDNWQGEVFVIKLGDIIPTLRKG